MSAWLTEEFHTASSSTLSLTGILSLPGASYRMVYGCCLRCFLSPEVSSMA